MTAPDDRPPFLLACIQYEPHIGDRAGNLAAMETRIRAAAARGAALIVLPELADSGYVFETTEEVAELSRPAPDGETTEWLCGLTAELGVHIVSGLAEEAGGRYYNSAVLCGPSGYLGTYRKLHLWDRETLFFAPGDLGLPVFDTPLGRIGMAICYDGWFPETFRMLADAGAEIVCIPTNWVPMPGQHPKDAAMSNLLHRAAAHCNGLYIACADRVGTERGQPFIGQSLIVDPMGFPIAGPADWQEEAILYAEIAPGSIAAARQINAHNHILGDRRPDVYGEPAPTGGNPKTTNKETRT